MGRNRTLEQLKTEVLDSIQRLQPAARLHNISVEDHLNSIHRLQPVAPEDAEDLSKNLQNLSTSMSQLASEGKAIASEQMVLKSLCFKTMKARHSAISGAHARTFEWIFKDYSPLTSHSHEFAEWLRMKNGIYWIMGKAGSGKSTLMKFICQDARTRKSLDTWAYGRNLVIAKYFFWNAGTKLQKSQEGLLRSLLFEILRQCPELISKTCSKRLEFTFSHDEPAFWTRMELLDVFNQLKECSVPAKFCFFIDGLDEYDGDDLDELIKVLQDLASLPNVKLCVSSRPWYSFRDAFGKERDRFLKLEDLTREDIRFYVNDKLEEYSRFRALKAKDSRYLELIHEIAEKAQGVFLWVFLVVRSLLRGLTYADRISDLQRRLRLLPQSLEEYFKQMLDSVEEVYQKQTAETFQVALLAEGSFSVITFSFLDEEDPNFAFNLKVEPMGDEEVISRREEIERRLDGRCKGLLEVMQSGNSHTFSEYRVEFLHRTVRDFLLTKDMQHVLEERVGPTFHPRKSLCKAFLAELKTVPPSLIRGSLQESLSLTGDEQDAEDQIIENLMTYVRGLEEEESVPQIALLDEAERAARASSSCWQYKEEGTAFLGLAVDKGLSLYVQHKLTVQPELLHANGRPLLYFALLPLGKVEGYGRDVITQTTPPNIDMVKLLLSFGASPNHYYEGFTVFVHFVTFMCRQNADLVCQAANFQETLELLVSHGADLKKLRTVLPKAEVLFNKSSFKTASELILNGNRPPRREKRYADLGLWPWLGGMIWQVEKIRAFAWKFLRLFQ
jgi:hypothetical protein